jgi:hypothetical protein
MDFDLRKSAGFCPAARKSSSVGRSSVLDRSESAGFASLRSMVFDSTTGGTGGARSLPCGAVGGVFGATPAPAAGSFADGKSPLAVFSRLRMR